jgi:nitrite reductase/ring-hydroxylating ferredoxin subunit
MDIEQLAGASTESCGDCPLVTNRRAFLRQLALAAVGSFAVAGLVPAAAFAENVQDLAPLSTHGLERRYALPTSDGVAIDSANEVIMARWQGHVYAFSLRCPHRGTTLVWHADEMRVFCPKHKARFRPDGAYLSGRTTRALDRYGLRLEGGAVVVELDSLFRADENPRDWNSAMLAI